MENQRNSSVVNSRLDSRVVPWGWLEKHAPSTFIIAGVLLLGSLVGPVILTPVTEWAWVAGIVIAGSAVVAVAAGLFGLYPRTTSHAPRLGRIGIVSGVIAVIAALILIAMGGIALLGAGMTGISLGKPMSLFVVVTLMLAVGFSGGFLSFGTVGLWDEGISRRVSRLLLFGGSVLLVPVAGGILRRGFGIQPGIPGWTFLPAIGLVTLSTLAIGYSLRS